MPMPSSAQPLFSGQFEDAVRRLNQAIEINPNAPHTHAILGRAMIYQEETNSGLASVKKAIRLSPRDPMVPLWYDILSIAAFVGERYDDTIGWSKTSISMAQFTNRMHDLSMTTARHVREDAFSRQPR